MRIYTAVAIILFYYSKFIDNSFIDCYRLTSQIIVVVLLYTYFFSYSFYRLGAFNVNISLGFMFDSLLKWVSLIQSEEWQFNSSGTYIPSNENTEMIVFTDSQGTISTLPNMNISTLFYTVWNLLGHWQRGYTESFDRDIVLGVQAHGESSHHLHQSQQMVMVKMPDTYSFHIPTHRFLAAIIKGTFKYYYYCETCIYIYYHTLSYIIIHYHSNFV